MAAWQPGPYQSVARKWLALAERRKAHLIELRESGRWRRFLPESELKAQLRELDLACVRFAEVAGIGSKMAAASQVFAASPAPRPQAKERRRLRA
jgi:hypothetical protein